jgi:DNA-directed RNA polymerase subunit RPC12/RpoP
MRLICFNCGKSVSNELPDTTTIRAALVCPECIEKGFEFSPLEWSTTPPSQPGWYWADHMGQGEGVVEVFEAALAVESISLLMARMPGVDMFLRLDGFVRWAGPIKRAASTLTQNKRSARIRVSKKPN